MNRIAKGSHFFVVAAPGRYGHCTRVVSSHRTFAAARRKVGSFSGWCVREGALCKGTAFCRVDEQIYRIATGEVES